MKKIKTLAILLISHALLSNAAFAGEGIRVAGPIGGTDIRQAWLPPPGVYGVGVALTGWFSKLWAESGTLDASGPFTVGGGGFLAVYPTQVAGGSIGSAFFMSGGQTCFRLKPLSESCSNGMGDSYADVLMWSRFFPSNVLEAKEHPFIPYGLRVLGGIGLNIPTGVYNSASPVNNGSNVWDIAPNIALTYTMPSLFGPKFGDATEFSVRSFYNRYTKNRRTDYQTGDIISADFGITQRVDQWQAGLTGTGYVQIEDDKIHATTVPGGNRSKLLQLGPVISYDFFGLGRPWNITFKGLFAATGSHTAAPNLFVIRIGMKLF